MRGAVTETEGAGGAEINLKVIAYSFGALVLALCGVIAYDFSFIVNVISITISLYVAASIVVEGGLKKFSNVFITALLFIIVSSLCFSFLQGSIALGVSLFVLLVLVKYSLIKDHDSGWFGAYCIELLGLVFLFIIELIVAVVICVGPAIQWTDAGAIDRSIAIEQAACKMRDLLAFEESNISKLYIKKRVGELGLLAPHIALAVAVVAVTVGTVYARKRWFGKAVA